MISYQKQTKLSRQQCLREETFHRKWLKWLEHSLDKETQQWHFRVIGWSEFSFKIDLDLVKNWVSQEVCGILKSDSSNVNILILQRFSFLSWQWNLKYDTSCFSSQSCKKYYSVFNNSWASLFCSTSLKSEVQALEAVQGHEDSGFLPNSRAEVLGR